MYYQQVASSIDKRYVQTMKETSLIIICYLPQSIKQNISNPKMNVRLVHNTLCLSNPQDLLPKILQPMQVQYYQTILYPEMDYYPGLYTRYSNNSN